MTQVAAIIVAHKNAVANTEVLNTALPGNLHHGGRVDLTTSMVFATIGVKDMGKNVYNSSGGWIAEYKVTIKAYVKSQVGRAGEILCLLHYYLDPARLPLEHAKILVVQPGENTIVEDKDEAYGHDVVVGETEWLLSVSEHPIAPSEE